ncbi:MAG TPA: NAD(+)/NADH kinase [bacterium]|nr:NAD(+)/NADH kinase [bacterium]
MKTIGLIANQSKENAVSVAGEIAAFCESGKIALYTEEWLAGRLGKPRLKKPFDRIVRDSDIVLVLGGDGTILSTAKRMKGIDTPLLGINLGGLGFLTSVRYQEIGSALRRIAEGAITTERRMMLSADILRAGKTVHRFDAANDIVVTKGALARMLNLEVFIDKEYLTNYTSDGLIVATPTGSTAHSLSAGGSIVTPDMPAMLITPICPHALGNRPLVVSEARTVRIGIRSDDRNVFLTIDGQTGAELSPGDEIRIRKSKQAMRLAFCAGMSYFGILREKLRWGGYSKVTNGERRG